MKKETYQTPDFNVAELDVEDLIRTSGGSGGGGNDWTGGGNTDPDEDLEMGPPF